jgi:hypothetical protein
VRCAACGKRWTAHAEPPLELKDAPAPAADAEASADDAAGAEQLGADDLPRAFRTRAEEEKRLRQAAITGARWAGAAVILAALALAAVLLRVSIVHVWPQTASVYAAIGLPVNPVGLVIEDVKAEPSLQQGHATLAVSGAIRNVEDRPIAAPPLRISLMSRQGRRVAGQIATLVSAPIPPGETRRFATAIFDPPFSAQDLQVDFAVGAKGQPPPIRTRTAPAAPNPAFQLRGPAANATASPPAAMPPPPARPTLASSPSAPSASPAANAAPAND